MDKLGNYSSITGFATIRQVREVWRGEEQRVDKLGNYSSITGFATIRQVREAGGAEVGP
jgi:hypothetical protein